jgi:hypothetical protein
MKTTILHLLVLASSTVAAACGASASDAENATTSHLFAASTGSSRAETDGLHYCSPGPSGWTCFGEDWVFDGPGVPPAPPWRPRLLPDLADADAVALSYGDATLCKIVQGSRTLACKKNPYEVQLPAGPFAPVPGWSNVLSVSARRGQTCALAGGKGVACAGDFQFGTTPPAFVPGTERAVQMSAGTGHVCALLDSGAVSCWGRNYEGALGNGSTVDETVDAPAAPVVGISDAVAVAAGHYASCALRRLGTVRCWGLNLQGNLGSGSLDSSTVPVEVVGITDATAVVMSYEYNGGGGGGPTLAVSDEPAGAFACAIVTGGHVKCWGDNRSGALGNGTRDASAVPVDVVGLSDVTSLALGFDGACAVLRGGALACWGNYPVPSPGSATSNATTPVVISGIPAAN